MSIARVCMPVALLGVVACSEVVTQPIGGGSSLGGAPGDGGAGGAPACGYDEFVERLLVTAENLGNGTPTGQCVSLPLVADADGHVSCIVVEARADMPAACTAQNRMQVRPELLEQVMASEAFDPDWTSICEVAQLSGAARDECINDLESSTPGFCFLVNDTVTIGNPMLTEYCAPPRQLLKLSGDVITPGVAAFIFCDDTPPPCP